MIESREDADYIGYLFGEYVMAAERPKTWLLPLASALQYFDPGSKHFRWPWLQEARKTLELPLSASRLPGSVKIFAIFFCEFLNEFFFFFLKTGSAPNLPLEQVCLGPNHISFKSDVPK